MPGNTYVLEFWAGGEYSPTYGSGLFGIDVGFGNTFLRDPPTEHDTGIGIRYIIEFNATSTVHTIKFTNWGHMGTICSELVLDDVQLYTHEELSDLVPHCETGIGESLINSFVKIFPNSFSDKLNVEVLYNELSQIVLYGIDFRKVINQNFIGFISLNTSQLSSGIYIYEVQNSSGIIKGKIIKQ
jgi:hypothetical protein